MKTMLVALAVLTFGVSGLHAEEKAETKVEKKDGKKNESPVVKLNKDNFDKTIKSGLVLVDFWAPWCGPCRKQGPIIDELAKEVGKTAIIGKANVDDNQQHAKKYKVSSIPTLIIFKDGKEVERLVGLQEKDVLLKALKKAGK